MMRELLAALLLGMVFVALFSPETAGNWLQRIDNVRYTHTMCE